MHAIVLTFFPPSSECIGNCNVYGSGWYNEEHNVRPKMKKKERNYRSVKQIIGKNLQMQCLTLFQTIKKKTKKKTLCNQSHKLWLHNCWRQTAQIMKD